MDKPLRKLGRQNLFNLIKNIHTKPTANIMLKDETLNAFKNIHSDPSYLTVDWKF